MTHRKITSALFFGNRGFFPASLTAAARRELAQALKKLGRESLVLDVDAEFLRGNRGRFGGVILSLPDFGDESGAVKEAFEKYLGSEITMV